MDQKKTRLSEEDPTASWSSGGLSGAMSPSIGIRISPRTILQGTDTNVVESGSVENDCNLAVGNNKEILMFGPLLNDALTTPDDPTSSSDDSSNYESHGRRQNVSVDDFDMLGILVVGSDGDEPAFLGPLFDCIVTSSDDALSTLI